MDYLIVGQGLAGSVLARKLMQQGQRVLVLDDHQPHSASRVAAGMFNPIVFKRLTKTWMSDTALPLALTFFEKWQAELGLDVLHMLPIIKKFPHLEAANDFAARSDAPGFASILSTEPHPDGEAMDTPFGYGVVHGGGYLELGVLLEQARKQWDALGIIRSEKFDAESLELHAEGVNYKGIQAKGILMCTGHELLEDGHFGYLPILRTQGELLEVESGRSYSGILNNGRWAIPLSEGRFRIGSSYLWHISDPSPTEAAKEQLQTALLPLLGETRVLTHKAGIRPAVTDRRPLLGTHPTHPRLHVFGGLGTRGVMVAPMCADWMLAHLVENQPLPADADISRFLKLFNKK